jgi:hypothetical protein
MSIPDIKDPVERFVAFIEERESIRERRLSGKPWPWTQDPILQSYRFTNVHREDDKVSLHYQKSIRNRYGEHPIVLPATVAYRWFNRISTCDAFFNEPTLANETIFEEYINTNNIQVLQNRLATLPSPHVTGAFIINGKPGFSKGLGVIEYLHDWCQRDWMSQFDLWKAKPPLLRDMYEWIIGDGLGSFMRGQIIADLKYLQFMLDVQDWWTWATPGPGSMRGLNIVFDREMNAPWPQGTWLNNLIILSEVVNPKLEEIGIGRLHNQDLQNCLCEFSKYTKASRGTGRPRQVFHAS